MDKLSQAGQNSNFSRDLVSYVIKIEKEGPRFGWWRPFSVGCGFFLYGQPTDARE